ncbi:hypothetical protein H257_16421 [Aphanomyces astaci]|uniref:Uncharacterized protein n=1 Tax=Aphanomyces astaci TaxID=112090 RepID=W4FKT5_APHAT|nr:hypothetical protein H257_16421 [Aphanomyces astaci]ETV67338.1 hypothetical protein H257_16421 [Aphanomyces astaci]|eukprot:XP_009843153.1 hypothetical protein H257_16421 [Aphanomyces astaci]
MPRLVVEVELYHRSLKGADKWARERADYHGRSELWVGPSVHHRICDGHPGVPWIRVLQSPLNADGTRPPVSPWQPPSNPTITVPATDLFYLRTDPLTHVRDLIPHANPHAQDFSLDLFRLFTRIDQNTVFD